VLPMAHSPALRPEPSEPAPSSDRGPVLANEPNLGEMTTTLAAQGIESSELALDLILHDIAERARLATGASGAAIALERSGSMVCRASAGGTAPDLGISINTESGLTGACVREERAQWCPDTEADDRVDAEACRQLQVRSIVVVPLFARERLAGVFEIFSSQPRAFGERELRALQELAVWVTEAVKGGGVKAAPEVEGVANSSPATHHAKTAQSGLVPLLGDMQVRTRYDDRSTKVLRAVVVGLAVLLFLLLGFKWGWQRARLAKDANTALPSVTGAEESALNLADNSANPSLGPTSGRFAKPSPAGKPQADALAANRNGQRDAQGSGGKAASGPKENASDREVLIDDSSKPNSKPAANDRTVTPASAAQRPASLESSVPLPSAVVAGVTASVLPPLSAAVPDKPATLAAPVSRGVTPGRLIRRVDPAYPSMALQQRISGSVQLQARIGTDGHVHDIKIVKGHPFLATAAIAAVRQWQYEPYKLNGQAVDLQTQITINFNLP
jgi:TonB family protein